MNKTGLLFLTLLVPGTAVAGGVYVGESGSQAMERAGAFVAKADDPTALSVNPAGLVKSRKIEIYLGANLLNMSLSYKRSGTYPMQNTAGRPQPEYVGAPFPEMTNDASFQAVPYLAASQRFGNFALGEGIFAPAGVPNRDFHCDVEDFCQVDSNGAPAPNRYDVVKQTALIAYPSLAAAYRVHPMLDVGARASWGFAKVEARNFPWALPNNGENPKAEGDFDTSVTDGFIFNWGAGLLFRPTTFLEFGASYSSAKTVNAKGTGDAKLGPEVNPLGDQVFIEPNPQGEGTCEEGGRIAELKTCVDFKLPQTLSIGGRFIVRDGSGGERADIELDGRWENHKNAADDTITVNGRDTLLLNPLKPVIARHGFRDVWSLRLGGSYRIDLGRNALSLRGGLAYDTAAAPASWTRVDKDGRARFLFGGGAAYDVGRWRFDIGFGYVAEGSITVTRVNLPATTPVGEREQPDPLQPSKQASQADYHPINDGTYTSNYIVGSLGVTAAF